MLKLNKQKILKNIVNNNIAIKYQYKNLILQSIIQNNNINHKTQLISKYFLKKQTLKNNKKICIMSGSYKGVYNKFNMSRHNVNYFSKLNLLQNYKLKSW